MRRLALSLVFIASILGLAAEIPAASGPVAAPAPSASAAFGPILEDDPAPLLGLALAEAIARYGAPASVLPVRGEEAWQDDVAFKYRAGYTLFLFGDRVWQLRFAAPYAGSVYGLFVGDSADKACSLLGEPYERLDASLVYRMPYRGYPVRLRLDLKDGAIADIYLYRADF
jgi:hypothetical protein